MKQVSIEKRCCICSKGTQFKDVENLEQFALEELHPPHSLMKCSRKKCSSLTHKKCLDPKNIHFDVTGRKYICANCSVSR